MMLRRFIQTVAKPLADTISVNVSRSVVAPIVSRFFSSVPQPEQQQPTKAKPSSSLLLKYHLTQQPNVPVKLAALTPLRSLGGLSLASYMAIEATEGHFDMLRSWQVDVAKDLHNALGRETNLRKELLDSEDRIEDLEIMVNDLTSFVELQKDEIGRLKARLA